MRRNVCESWGFYLECLQFIRVLPHRQRNHAVTLLFAILINIRIEISHLQFDESVLIRKKQLGNDLHWGVGNEMVLSEINEFLKKNVLKCFSFWNFYKIILMYILILSFSIISTISPSPRISRGKTDIDFESISKFQKKFHAFIWHKSEFDKFNEFHIPVIFWCEG